MRRILSILAALSLLALGSFATASTASAASRNGVCEGGEVCFYYLSSQSGSVSDFTTSVPNYGSSQPGCYEFKGTGFGKGQCIKNNVRSVKNRTSRVVAVYYNSNYGGAVLYISPNSSQDLGFLSDDNASHRFL